MEVFLLIVLVLVSAFFAAAEVSFLSLSSVRFHALLERNAKGAESLGRLRSKRRCIGNLELPQDKLAALKEKLQGEIADTLQKNRTATSIVEIVGKGN